MSIIIVGTGIAGYTLARELRKIDADCSIVLLTADSGANVYKPNLSKALAMDKSPNDLVMQSVEDMAAQLNVEIMPNSAVAAIKPEQKAIELADGRLMDYSALVLAVGASQRELPVVVAASDQAVMHSVNDLADYQRFREQLDGLPANAHVGIIGGGLIGCEFANDLVAQGYRASVVEPMAWPMGQLLPEPCGHAVQQGLAAIGVDWQLETVVESIATDDEGVKLELANGQSVVVDMVLSATGLLPNVQLAKDAEIEVGRGVVINDYAQTSDENVYALGDCAELDGVVLPYVAPIIQQAKALAATLTGTPTAVRYAALPVAVKTPACPVVVSPVYDAALVEQGTWHIEGEGLDWQAVFYVGDQPHGFVLTGDKVSARMQWTRALPAWR